MPGWTSWYSHHPHTIRLLCPKSNLCSWHGCQPLKPCQLGWQQQSLRLEACPSPGNIVRDLNAHNYIMDFLWQALAIEKLLLVTSTVEPSAAPPPRPALHSLPPVNENLQPSAGTTRSASHRTSPMSSHAGHMALDSSQEQHVMGLCRVLYIHSQSIRHHCSCQSCHVKIL